MAMKIIILFSLILIFFNINLSSQTIEEISNELNVVEKSYKTISDKEYFVITIEEHENRYPFLLSFYFFRENSPEASVEFIQTFAAKEEIDNIIEALDEMGEKVGPLEWINVKNNMRFTINVGDDDGKFISILIQDL